MAGGMMIELGPAKGPKAGPPGLKDDAEQTAVKRFFEAGQSGDWVAATAAFKRAYEVCAGGSEGEAEAE